MTAKRTVQRLPKHLANDFREIAREIIADDRKARKYGRSQNTIGRIATALGHAYRLGAIGDAGTPHGGGTVLRWQDIPPTGRKVLCLAAIGLIFGKDTTPPSFIKVVLADGGVRWRTDSNQSFEEMTSRKGLGPLLKLGLLKAESSDEGEIKFTPSGIKILHTAVAQYKAGDTRILSP